MSATSKTHNLPAAAIIGVEGLRLTAAEKKLFRKTNPLGFILFARNVESPKQISALTDELKSCVSHPHPLILIDQEGGRVRRLRPPHWYDAPAAAMFAALAEKNLTAAKKAVRLSHHIMALEMSAIGINVDCAPVLDLLEPKADAIISDRAFGKEPKQVIALAEAVCEGLRAGGVLPVIKHIPGHGRANVDSHKALPIVKASRKDLEARDAAPFKAFAHEIFAMTAHIQYTAIDADRPITFSPEGIEWIRTSIGFQGVIMSDDLAMKALKGTYLSRSKRALSAGCDVLLHCNLPIEKLSAILPEIPPISKQAYQKIAVEMKTLKNTKCDVVAAKEMLRTILAPVIKTKART